MMNSYPNNDENDERQHLLGAQSNAVHTDYGVNASVMIIIWQLKLIRLCFADMSVKCI